MPKFLFYLLIPFSWLYGLIISFRKWLYKSGLYTRSKFDFPIICVGNITAGGTGKTPHIEWLIKNLSGHYRVAVLSRGYKRKTIGYVLSTPVSTPEQIGDEPYQIKQKFLQVPVAVSENRVLGIPMLLGDEPNTEVVLMDDGFQHLSIQAGFNIVLCDYNRPYYNDFLLPAEAFCMATCCATRVAKSEKATAMGFSGSKMTGLPASPASSASPVLTLKNENLLFFS
jgi:tetraacyldisaccharide 4'-kinase